MLILGLLFLWFLCLIFVINIILIKEIHNPNFWKFLEGISISSLNIEQKFPWSNMKVDFLKRYIFEGLTIYFHFLVHWVSSVHGIFISPKLSNFSGMSLVSLIVMSQKSSLGCLPSEQAPSSKGQEPFCEFPTTSWSLSSWCSIISFGPVCLLHLLVQTMRSLSCGDDVFFPPRISLSLIHSSSVNKWPYTPRLSRASYGKQRSVVWVSISNDFSQGTTNMRLQQVYLPYWAREGLFRKRFS